jgi:hypothetical protein
MLASFYSPETFCCLFLVLISVKRLSKPHDLVRLEGLGKLKIAITSSSLEHVTFWLTA